MTVAARPGRRRQPGAPTNDVGSLGLAMLFAVVSMSLTVFMSPVVVAQVKNTSVASDRLHAMHAAQAGITVALGQMRAATADNPELGDPSKLPCGPFTGPVGDGNNGTYSVTVVYVAADPKGAWNVANPLDCRALTTAPAYAILKATGSVGSATRTLRTTYRFRSTWPNIPGGQLHHYVESSLCLDATSRKPAKGTAPVMRTCVPGGTDSQTFAFFPNSTIVLVSSRSTDYPYGLCLDAGVNQATGDPVKLQPCAKDAPGHQVWGFNQFSRFTGNKDDLTPSDLCINVTEPKAESTLLMGVCDYNLDNAFAPDATVGPGSAGQQYTDEHGVWEQLVNNKQFSRCIDVSFFNPNLGYLVAWPCRVGASNITWNQQWYLPSTGFGPIMTYADGRKPSVPAGATAYPAEFYCLQPPVGGTPGGYVTLSPCRLSKPSWEVVREPDGWKNNFRIIDKAHCLCLAAKDATLGDFMPISGIQVSKVVAAPCSSDPLQKWNAPPRPVPPILSDTAER